MQKAKTKKAVVKRCKITGKGKISHSKAGRSHLMRKKTSRRRLHLKKKELIAKSDLKKIKKLIPYNV